VNLLGDNKVTRKKNTGIVIDASKEVGLEVNAEKTKYMLIQQLMVRQHNNSSSLPPMLSPQHVSVAGSSPQCRAKL
jgi:hypothetical protein